MGLGGVPKGADYRSVTLQEPLPGPGGPLVKESRLPPPNTPEKPPEPAPQRSRKLPVFLRRVSRVQLLAVIAVLILIIVVLSVSLAVSTVLSANQRSDERGQTAGSAAEDLKCSDLLPPCGDGWIWYRNKCYYFSDDEGTWTVAKDSCAALNSSLAVIDTQKDLDFMLRYKGDPDHWAGLWRDSDKRWRWINGTEFNNWFTVADYSDYAYLNHDSVRSGEKYNTRNWICSKVSAYETKYEREKTVPSFG